MSDHRATETVPLLEEELLVGKQSVVTGTVRVQAITDTFEEIAHASLEEENVEVSRVPIGREISARPAVRTEGDVVIVPVIEEILVVEKRLVLKEELHIRRIVSRKDFEVPVTLRKQRGVVERVDADPDLRGNEERQP